MGELTLKDILDLGSNLSVVVGLILVLVGGRLKWWVWGYQYEQLRTDMREQIAEERAETHEWKALALRNLEVAKVLVSNVRPSTEGPSS